MMKLETLNRGQQSEKDARLIKGENQVEKLLNELSKKDLPEDIISKINEIVIALNKGSATDKDHKKQLRKSYDTILKLVQKQLRFVPKNYNRNLWLVLGMSSIGVPMGLVFGLALDNMAFLGVGLPLGMVIGIAIGSGLDSKAQKENRQLDIDV